MSVRNTWLSPLSVTAVIKGTRHLWKVHHWVLWWWLQRPTTYTEFTIECYGRYYRDTSLTESSSFSVIQRPTTYIEFTLECYCLNYRDPRLHRDHNWVRLKRPIPFTWFLIECNGLNSPLTQCSPVNVMVLMTETLRLQMVHHWVLWWWLQRPTSYTEFTTECYGGDYRDSPRTQSSPLSAMVVIIETHCVHRVHHWVLWWWLQRPTAYTEFTFGCYGGDYRDPLRTQSSPLSVMVVITATHH